MTNGNTITTCVDCGAPGAWPAWDQRCQPCRNYQEATR